MNAVYSSRTFGGDKRRAWEAVVSQLYASMDVQVRGVPEFQGEITHCLLDDLDLTHVIADYEIASRRQGFLIAQGKHIVPTEAGLSLFGVLKQADPALVDPGVMAQLECLLDDVVVGNQEMVGAIDAVCSVAERIIGKLKEGCAAGGASLAWGGGRRLPRDVSADACDEALCRQPRRAEGYQASTRLQDVDIDLPKISQRTRAQESRG